MKLGDSCPLDGCDGALHRISGAVLAEVAAMPVTLHSPTLPKALLKAPIPTAGERAALVARDRAHLICPICDAYALGAEFENGAPIEDATGRSTTIHEIFDARDAARRG